jgi:deoxyribodipyrimidine photolyase-related protein
MKRMSDYCSGCRHKVDINTGPVACLLGLLYLDFSGRHEERFQSDMSVSKMVKGWKERSDGKRVLIPREARDPLGGRVDDGFRVSVWWLSVG